MHEMVSYSGLPCGRPWRALKDKSCTKPGFADLTSYFLLDSYKGYLSEPTQDSDVSQFYKSQSQNRMEVFV